jgi:hypothetical protein
MTQFLSRHSLAAAAADNDEEKIPSGARNKKVFEGKKI